MLEVHVAELNGFKHTVVGLIRQDTVALVMSKERATKQDISGRAVQRNFVLGGGMCGTRAHTHAHAIMCL